MKKRITFLLLPILLVAACKSADNANVTHLSTGDQIIHDAKVYGPALEVAIDEGINQEALLAANGTIDPDLHKTISQWLTDTKSTLHAFNEQATGWSHFDPANKADIAKLLDTVLAFVDRIYKDGVLKIKNPQSQATASGILSGAKFTLTLWKSSFQESAQP